MNFKGTKGNWILDSDDMLTIRAINDLGRIFIAKSDTVGYYEKGYKLNIAKAMAKKDNIEVERLRKELFQFDEEQFENAKLIIDAGNTIQQCDLLPSELLKHRNGLLEMLVKAERTLREVYECDTSEIKQLIKEETE